MRVLGISGSLRAESHNSELLRAAAALAPADVSLEVWDGLAAVPPYDEDVDGQEPVPLAVAKLRRELAEADAVLFATPEYNGSIPGQLKNALDWASRPFATNPLRRKPVAVVGASTGLFGAVWAQAELRKVLNTMGATVVDDDLPIPMADSAFEADGRLTADEHAQALEALLSRLHASATALEAAA